jgi:hypothetical protein
MYGGQEAGTKCSVEARNEKPTGVEARALVPGARVWARGWFQEQFGGQGGYQEQMWRPMTGKRRKCGGLLLRVVGSQGVRIQ